MEKLTKTEEPIMQIIWDLKMVFIKDIIQAIPDPKPPYNTISSVVRILEDKGMVGHDSFGRTHRYYPAISKTEYRKLLFSSILKDYFDNSHLNLMSHIVDSEDLSKKEIQELKKLIDKNEDD